MQREFNFETLRDVAGKKATARNQHSGRCDSESLPSGVHAHGVLADLRRHGGDVAQCVALLRRVGNKDADDHLREGHNTPMMDVVINWARSTRMSRQGKDQDWRVKSSRAAAMTDGASPHPRSNDRSDERVANPRGRRPFARKCRNASRPGQVPPRSGGRSIAPHAAAPPSPTISHFCANFIDWARRAGASRHRGEWLRLSPR